MLNSAATPIIFDVRSLLFTLKAAQVAWRLRGYAVPDTTAAHHRERV